MLIIKTSSSKMLYISMAVNVIANVIRQDVQCPTPKNTKLHTNIMKNRRNWSIGLTIFANKVRHRVIGPTKLSPSVNHARTSKAKKPNALMVRFEGWQLVWLLAYTVEWGFSKYAQA